MDSMDYTLDIDEQTMTSHHNTSQSRCPYRMSSLESPNVNFHFHSPHPPPPFDPVHPPFDSISNPPRMLWGSVMPPLQPQEAIFNRYPPIYRPNQQGGRASAQSNFDSYVAPENQTQPHFNHTPQRHPRFDDSRPQIPRLNPLRPDGNQSSGGNGTVEGQTANNSRPPTHPETSSFQDFFLRRSDANQEATRMPPIQAPGNTNVLPIPAFQPQNVVPFHHQGQQFPPASRPDPFAPQNTQNPRHLTFQQTSPSRQDQRGWFSEQFVPRFGEPDSDSDSTEALNDGYGRRQQTREEANQRSAQERSVQTIAASRRRTDVNLRAERGDYGSEERELAIERTRAARRAQVASVKFVASAQFLTTLEIVDKSTLAGEDINCTICYNEYGVQNPDGKVEKAVRLPKCKHLFGDDCLKEWLKDSDTCPYCRDKLPSEPKRNGQPDAFGGVSASQRAIYVMTQGRDGHVTQQALEFQRQAQATLTYHQELSRLTAHAAEIDEQHFPPRYRRHGEWSSLASQQAAAASYAARSVPDSERRRTRTRTSSIRNSPQNPGRPSGPSGSRSARSSDLQGTNVRPLAMTHHSSPSFEDNTSPRSVTPHPGAPNVFPPTPPAQAMPTSSHRPSSLPSESSPLREATFPSSQQQTRNAPSSGANGLANVLNSSPQRVETESLRGPSSNWDMPAPNTGRPVSATFLGEMPHTRLHRFGDDLDSFASNRLAPFMAQNHGYENHFIESTYDPSTGLFMARQ